MNEIPEFLLANASRSTIDQKKLLLDMQLWALWKEVFPAKPYVHADAVELQKRLAMQHAVHSRKEHEKRLKNQENDLKSLQSICRLVAEHVLGVEITCDGKEISVPNEAIDWNTKIKDRRRRGKTLGVVRQLLQDDHFDFTSCGDPRVDLKSFIHKLKQFDDVSRKYTFERPHRIADFDPNYPHMVLEQSPFPEKVPRYVSFILKFKWKPFSDKQLLKEAKSWLKPYVG